MTRLERLEPVSRGVLEATARIMGPLSAAAKALADADTHAGPVRFYKSGNTLIVEKINKEWLS